MRIARNRHSTHASRRRSEGRRKDFSHGNRELGEQYAGQSQRVTDSGNRLSEYVRAAAAGETVLVTDRGQVVAELVSPRVRADASPAERLLGDLLRQGLLAPSKVSPKARLPRRKPVAKFDELLRDLDESRAER